MKPRRIVIGGAVLALLVALGCWLLWPSAPPTLSLPDGQSLDVAQLEELTPLPEFSLERKGPPLTAADLRGRWSFVYFGYTNCPDACPATLGMLSHVQEGLQSQGLAPPRIVFVSLDPRRDTPELLHRYLAEFGPEAIGATGSDAALRGLVTFFGVTFERKDQTDKTNYTIDHTTNFFLVTPDGRWLATFAPADDAESVLEDTLKLMRMPLP
ncbi:putative Electron transport protein SCO1/SenC [Burkholderiales bacterium]|nr:putative Electron transport protein SCO1/SenC [Burkholderiales bacterium]